MIIMFLVGIIFFLFGLSLFLVSLYYRMTGELFHGSIAGYHKKMSYSQQNKSKQLYYYPLIEYLYKGSTYIHSPYGSNKIKWKIGEKVKLYKLKKGPEYVTMKSGAMRIFSSLFLVIGFALIYSYLKYSENLELWELLIPLYLVAVLLFIKTKKKISFAQIKDATLKSKAYKKSDFKDKEVLWSQDQINNELNKSHSIAFKITGVLMLLSYSTCAYFLERIPEASMEHILQIFNKALSDPSSLSLLKDYSKAGPELYSAIFITTSLVFTYSFIYCWKVLRNT